MAKIRRNSLCNCGSGKKYKKCHGSIETMDRIHRTAKELLAEHQAKEVQRKQQQGLGRPIISTEINGERFVAVRNKLMHSRKWKTFHDFLFSYIANVMSPEWGNGEIGKPLAERHPILIWYNYLCEQQQKHSDGKSDIKQAPMTGAIAAYLNLANDLYALDHNIDLQGKLIARLQNHDNFYGARYEVYVAACLIRAGFLIDFENEDDRNSTHCEFVATDPSTGRKFSVEAKRSHSNKKRFGKLLLRALAKNAEYERIVFIDMNLPETSESGSALSLLNESIRQLRKHEHKDHPEAYVFFTNTPWHHQLNSEHFQCTVIAEGFKIPTFKMDARYSSLREAINARETHVELHNLLKSMQLHSHVPTTFSGEIPLFEYGESEDRLLIGKRYKIPDDSGLNRIGLITSAVVLENEKNAVCAIAFENGVSELYKFPLSDGEMDAWRMHPDTFFGVLTPNNKTIVDPLGLYDFYLETYKQTPKEKLLEFLAGIPNFDELVKLNQKDLASIYSEYCTNAALASFERGA